MKERQQGKGKQQGGPQGREQRREQGRQNPGRQQGGQTEGGQQAGNLDQYLQGCEWPCEPDEVERVAKQNNAPARVLEQIRALPDREFEDQREFEENFQQTTTTH